MFPVSPARTRNRGRGFGFNRGAKIPPSLRLRFNEGIVDPRITYTGSNGTYFNSAGTLTAATTNVPRIDYDPATLICRGLLIEESRTNSIRNNTMQGASAGTPGTDPTNWQITAAGGSLTTKSIVAVSSSSGIGYVDVRFVASGAVTAQIIFEQNTQIAASNGQTWTGSNYISLAAGSLTNLTVSNRVAYRNGVGTIVTVQNNSVAPTSAAVVTQRTINTFAATDATTAAVTSAIVVDFTGAGDVTLRIGMPQLELGASATSVIQTSSAAVTRAADIASMTGTNFSGFWNATQGTIVAQYLFNRTIGSGEFPVVAAANDGTTSNAIESYAFLAGGNNRSSFTGSVAGVSQFDLGSGSATFNGASGTAHKLASAYAVNNFAAAFDGSAVLTDTSGSLPTVDRMTLGAQGNGTQFLNGWISSLSYYPVRLSDSQLRSLSA